MVFGLEWIGMVKSCKPSALSPVCVLCLSLVAASSKQRWSSARPPHGVARLHIGWRPTTEVKQRVPATPGPSLNCGPDRTYRAEPTNLWTNHQKDRKWKLSVSGMSNQRCWFYLLAQCWQLDKSCSCSGKDSPSHRRRHSDDTIGDSCSHQCYKHTQRMPP